MITRFKTAIQTMEKGLASSQIGRPVAARIIMHHQLDAGQMERLAAVALCRCETWLGSKASRVFASGGALSEQITILASFDAGQSALLSVGTCGHLRPLAMIQVWGSRGMLSWEDDGNVEIELGNGGRVDDLAGESGAALDAHESRIRQLLEAEAKEAEPVARGLRDTGLREVQPQSPPYGVLLVAGDHTHQPSYAAALVADGRCRLVGLADEPDVSSRRKSLNEQLARRLGIPVLPDLTQALTRDDVHIVSLCAEPVRRGPIAVLAARAGKHLYLDKPLAGSMQHADAIAAAVRDASVVDHMFSLVHSESAHRLRQILNSCEVDGLKAIHFDMCFAKGTAGTAQSNQHRAESPEPERFELEDSKRELTNVGVYPLVQLLSLIPRQVHRVTATTGNYFFREHELNDMEDFGQLLLEFDGGLVASISAGRTGWQSHPGGGLNRVCAIGKERCFVVDAHRPRVEAWSDAPPWSPPSHNPEDPMGMWPTLPDSRYTIEPRHSWITPPGSHGETDASHFLDCIEYGRRSMISVDVAALATEILMAGYQSAATLAPVTLPLSR